MTDFRNASRYLVFALLILFGMGLAGCRLLDNDGAGGNRRSRNRSSNSQLQVCPIDGAKAKSTDVKRRPLAVLIENSPQARPQTGLNDACVVYESITEGGITRFLAIYLHRDPEVVGPVRSARPHFIYLAREYDAALVHCGESYEALQILAATPEIMDLDQLEHPKYFKRDNTRRAPHNLYTSAKEMRKAVRDLNWDSSVRKLPRFTADGKWMGEAPAKRVDISFGGAVRYRLRFEYDAESGGYKRYMDGKLHVDRVTGKPVMATNIVIQRVFAEEYASSDKGTWDVQVLGSGAGLFIAGGKYMDARWEKWYDSAITTFTSDTGDSLPMTSGQTWVEVIPIDGRVTITGPRPSGA